MSAVGAARVIGEAAARPASMISERNFMLMKLTVRLLIAADSLELRCLLVIE